MIDWRARPSVEGASTLTQQLAKLRLVGNAPTIDRKVREALLAFEIERRFTKPQILEMYLNSVFFGDTAWVTKAASQIYFHKQTKDLHLAQASTLARVHCPSCSRHAQAAIHPRDGATAWVVRSDIPSARGR